MSEYVINLKDINKLNDKLKTKIADKLGGGPKGTRIIITDHDTGEVLHDTHNKILITGGQFTACKQFNVDPVVIFKSYNEDMTLDNTDDYSSVLPKNEPFVSLFCLGQSGCGATPNDVYPVKYTERIEPVNDMVPFRYVDSTADLDDDLRKMYFGRKTLTDAGKIAYYFKVPDTEPQLHLRYLDGTQITENMYNVDTEQDAECFIEERLRITRNDFRDYFEKVLGWDKALINTLSLCYAWYDDTIDSYKWYQQIYPYSKLNFSSEYLADLTKAIDFNYQIYF